MAKQSSVNLDITNNADGFDISGGTTPRKLGITGGDVTIAGSGSATVTFPTTSTTIAGLGITQSFSALQTFTAGISAAGGATLGARVDITGILDVVGGVTLESTLDVAGVSRFAGGVTLAGTFSGTTGSFSKLLTLSNGLSAAGGVTFASDIRVNTITVGVGNVGVAGFNTAVGSGVLRVLGGNLMDDEAKWNTGLGYQALYTNTYGSSNTAIGTFALNSTDGAFDNVAVGRSALSGNRSGGANVGVGSYALSGCCAGYANVGIGYQALGGITGTSNNTALGYRAGLLSGTGSSYLTSATGGIYLGYQARGSTNGQTNEIVIGRDAVGLGSNTTVLGATTAVSATIYGLVNAPSGISAAGATFSGNIFAPNIVNSFNGSTGAVQGVSAAVGSTYLTVSGSTGSVTFTNTGVQTFNGLTGAVTGVTTGVANTFGPLQSFTSGISAAGATFSGNVSAQSTLYTDNILAIGNQINIANAAGGRIAFGDYDGAGNSTYVFIRDATSSLLISNPYGAVGIGDPNNVDSGNYLAYDAASAYLDGGNSALTNFSTGSFNGLLTASAGISAAGGVTFAGTFSGTTGSFSRLLTASAGISASGGITLSGTLSLDTNALISSPSATAKAIKSTVPAGTGVTPTVQIICPSSAQSLLNQTATQPVFSTPQDTITLQASTTYMFEGLYLLSTGTVSHTTAISFVLTTATMTNCTWIVYGSYPAFLNSFTNGIGTTVFDSVTGGVFNSANAQPYTVVRFQGVMRVNAAGTLVPNIAFGTAPGGTNTTMIGSYLKFYPIGSNTIDFVGSAIG